MRERRRKDEDEEDEEEEEEEEFSPSLCPCPLFQTGPRGPPRGSSARGPRGGRRS